METEITFKKTIGYGLLPLCFSVLVLFIRDSFFLIGIAQFFVGGIQLLIAVVKTLFYGFSKEAFPYVLKFYWAAVLIYCIIGFIGAAILEYLEIDHELLMNIGLIYLVSAWTIAVYHFKHIMLLKM